MSSIDPGLAAEDALPPSKPISGFKIGAANVALRGLTMASKFVLVVLIARYLGNEALGRYALVLATIITVTNLISLRFDMYSTREICSVDPRRHFGILRNMAVFHGLMILLAAPATLLLFAGGLLQWSLALPFYALLVLEHLSGELSRVLVPLRRPVHSNFILFLRSGLWVYVLGALLIVSPGHRSLANVWLFWAVGAFASVALALIWIWRLTRPAHEPTTVDWPWIRRGVKMSIVFTLGAFFLNAMFTVDRYILSYYHGEAQVGVYALYGNIANLIQTVAETGVAVVLLPAILAAYARGNQAGYEAAMRQFSRRIYQSLFFSVGIAVAGAAVALSLTGPAYSAHLLALGLLLLMGVVNTVAMIPHYGLYARSNDRRMALGNLIGLLVALALHAALVPAYGITGAAVASLLGMTAVLVSKILLYRQAVAQDSR